MLLVCLQASAATPGRLLKVGAEVCLASGYEGVEDASDGPLTPGMAGKILEDDHSGSKPWRVRVSPISFVWHYHCDTAYSEYSYSCKKTTQSKVHTSNQPTNGDNAMSGIPSAVIQCGIPNAVVHYFIRGVIHLYINQCN